MVISCPPNAKETLLFAWDDDVADKQSYYWCEELLNCETERALVLPDCCCVKLCRFSRSPSVGDVISD